MAERDPNSVASALHYEDNDNDEQEQMNQSDNDLERIEENNENENENNDIDDNDADDDFIHDRNDEDPVAEGEDPVPPKPEPSYAKASETKFFSICKGLEVVCRNNRKRKYMSDVDKLKTILKPEYLHWLSQQSSSPDDGGDDQQQQPPESIFPLLRLLLPDKDGSRSFLMKEKMIGKMYIDAFSFAAGTSKYNKLIQYTNPNIVSPNEGVGDLSLVVQNIMNTMKRQTTENKGLSIGELNKLLDELVSLPRKARDAKSNHDWRNKNSTNNDNNVNNNNNNNTTVNKKPPTLNSLRADWLRMINTDTTRRLGLSPLEHKWLVRILLNRLHVGVGWKTILKWYNPYAAMLWSAHNSLKGICDKLCDPEFSQAQQDYMKNLQQSGSTSLNSNSDDHGLDSYMKKSMSSPQWGIPFSPMLSERTGFDRVLNDISNRHRSYLSSDDAKHYSQYLSHNSISFQHPAFTIEPKLDGERILVHVNREGIVKMHTRRGNWYSDLYTPVLGPPIRRAVGKWDFDLILDGEVLAWDGGRQETVPFGNNRTIARLRKAWMKFNNLLDPRDQDLHTNETNVKSMNPTNTWPDRNNSAPYELAGKECWLQFIAFDVIYIDGPNVIQFLKETLSSYVPISSGGSIIGLDGFERKKVLHKLISIQKDEVEVVKTWVIRPNGRISPGESYFNPYEPATECGYPEYTLDSLNCILSGSVPNLKEIDMDRRKGLSDEQISQARAYALQKIYDIIVENQRMEGLVFKDLSAPYYLGEESKATRYWHKFKPDYFNGSVASDIDVIVIGAYFATGLRFSGKPSSFLCACIDAEDDEKYLTLCKVNMGSTDNATANRFLEMTGFSASDESISDSNGAPAARNCWFREVDHGKSLPDFLSKRSYQGKSLDGTWRFDKGTYPDLWIHPDDSRILTLNAGEIVISETFAAGVTLRFPRINKIRFDGDDKPRSEIENDRNLWLLYQDVMERRTGTGGNNSCDAGDKFKIGSPIKNDFDSNCRFLTEEQFRGVKRKPRRTRINKPVDSVDVSKATRPESIALKGLTFHVFEGIYDLRSSPSAMEEAQEQGWSNVGIRVRSFKDVQTFILNHGGKSILVPDFDVIVLGGSTRDPRVLAYIRSIEMARAKQRNAKKLLKSKKAQYDAAVSKMEGCLRWTFVYSLVYSWLNQTDIEGTSRSQIPINESDPNQLSPSALDFLARPTSDDEKINDVDVKLLNTDITSVVSLRRALEIVSDRTLANNKRAKCIEQNENSWQDAALKHLALEDRWAVAGSQQILWPYKRNSDDNVEPMILYPHIFTDHGENKEMIDEEEIVNRWKLVLPDPTTSVIESALPLARMMGAVVSTHLNCRVTHVLCDLKDQDTVMYSDKIVPDSFLNSARAVDLLARLSILSQIERNKEILLISPNWTQRRT